MLATLGDVDLTLTTNGALLARKARALRDAGPAPRHGQPRRARRRDVPRDERRRLPGRARARGHRRRGGRRACADQGQHGRQARRQRARDRADGATLPRHAATSCASSSTWTSAHTNGWRMDDVVPAQRDRAAHRREMPLEPVDPNYRGEVAERWRYRDGSGEVGVIASVTQAFCRDCTRARLSTDGKLYTCLFAHARPRPARPAARGAQRRRRCAATIAAIWRQRGDRYSEIRTADDGRAAEGRDVVHRRLMR